MTAGQYTFELRRSGYDSWKRAINVEGGAVVRFDYPVLFPSKLTTETVKRYEVQPPLMLQSPDRRWVLMQNPSSLASFESYDLTNIEDPTTTVTIPDSVVTLKDGLQRWSLVEWARDSRRVLLLHTSEKDGAVSSEYILFDRDTPAESRNLTRELNAGAATISLRALKFDRYYLYDAAAKTVSTASLDAPAPVKILDNVLVFKSHGDNRLLYATTQDAPEGKVVVKLREGDGDRTYPIRTLTASQSYLVDIALYRGKLYVVAGSPAENRTYVYQDPVASLRAEPTLPLVPVQVLKAANAHYVAFSENGRFILAQGGQQISVYDSENDRGYAYTLDALPDAPQSHVTWMDGHRIMAVMGGKVHVLDFDNANSHTLVAASPAFLPLFDSDFSTLYAITPQIVKAADGTETTQYDFGSTSLLTEADQ
jgi:hypothetical protein